MPPIDPAEFVAAVQPLLAGCDAPGLVALINSRWTHEQIADLFRDGDSDVRKVAALAFALVGKKCCLGKLAPLLKDRDPVVNQMAEHAMWSVWFRSGTPEANHQLCRGTKALNRRDFEHAVEHFSARSSSTRNSPKPTTSGRLPITCSNATKSAGKTAAGRSSTHALPLRRLGGPGALLRP